MNEIQYLGHSSFRIVVDDIICLINPVTSVKIRGEKRLIGSSVDMNIRKCDLIILTHEQPEACEPETIKIISERTFASVIAPKPALAKIDIAEKFKVDVRIEDRFNIKGLDIEVKKAVHPQSSYPVGFVLKGSKWKIYIAGDTYSYVGMANIDCDIAILPIGGTYTMDPFAAANACKEIRPKYAIPCSFNTTQKLRQDISDFISGLPSYTKPIVLRVAATAKLS